MNVQEFYNYITSKMTAEQALLKLLEGQCAEYERLKFSSDENAIHPELLIAMAAFEMGWNLAIPEGKDDDELKGMIVGTDEYINSVLSKENE